jgi:hypothetical protein
MPTANLFHAVTEMRTEMEELRSTMALDEAHAAEEASRIAGGAVADVVTDWPSGTAAQSFVKNAVITAPPFCKLPAKTAAEGLPVFVFVAGVEGSGHHALKDVWHSLSAAGVCNPEHFCVDETDGMV